MPKNSGETSEEHLKSEKIHHQQKLIANREEFEIKQKLENYEFERKLEEKMELERREFDKKYCESIGQGYLFGHDNLFFKTVNLPKKQRLTNLCKKFSLKIIIKKNLIFLRVIRML